MPAAAKRLIAPLLHVSTLSWFMTGFLLVWAGFRAGGEARWVICGAALVIYGHAAIANVRAVRSFHPGWVLMTLALLLILLGIA